MSYHVNMAYVAPSPIRRSAEPQRAVRLARLLYEGRGFSGERFFLVTVRANHVHLSAIGLVRHWTRKLLTVSIFEDEIEARRLCAQAALLDAHGQAGYHLVQCMPAKQEPRLAAE